MTTSPHTQSGFTLIELIIASAIAVVAIAVVTSLAIDVTGFSSSLGSRIAQESEIAPFLRLIVSELRSIGPAENGAYHIAHAEAQTLSFYADVDDDGSFELVRYYLDGTTLRKGVIQPTATQPPTYPPATETVTDVVTGVVPGPIFMYYTEGYPPVVTPLPSPVPLTDIRLVTVSLTVDQDPNTEPGPSTLSVSATIRNLRGDI